MKNWRAIPVALLLVAGAAACGDDDGGDEESGLSDLTTTSVADSDETTTTSEDDEDAETTTTTEADSDADVELPDGWTPVEHDEFTMALPSGWQEANELVEDPEFAAYVDQAMGGEAGLDQMLAQLDVMAVDTETVASGFATNLNVIVNPLNPADSIDLVEQQVRPALQAQLGAVVTSTERTTIGGEEALRVEYDYDTPQVSLKGLQFYILGEELSGVVTFTAAADAVDHDTWEQIIETFSFAS